MSRDTPSKGFLRVQWFLMSRSLNELKEAHGVDHKIVRHKITLNYNQLNSRSGDPLAGECRGLILRKRLPSDLEDINPNVPLGKTKILAYPFNRFYNQAETCAAEIDWASARIQEKLDGSLIILHYDDIQRQYHVATRKVCEANLDLQGFGFTFRELFERALENHGLHWDNLSTFARKNRTYCFELTSPYNRIVVSYEEARLTLLGVRNNDTLKEEIPAKLGQRRACCPGVFIPKPKTYLLDSVEDIISFVNEQNPTEQEGVVVVDSSFSRIKIKSLSYVAFNRTRDKLGASYRNCLSLVLEEKVDDCIGKLPKEIEDILLDMREKISFWFKFQEDVFQAAYSDNVDSDGEVDMKGFANQLSQSKEQLPLIWSGPMFQVARGKAPSFREAVCKKKPGANKYPNSLLDTILGAIDVGQKKKEE